MSPAIITPPTLEWYYRNDFATRLRRSPRVFARLVASKVVPVPDGKDATGHSYWLPATVDATVRAFLGIETAE